MEQFHENDDQNPSQESSEVQEQLDESESQHSKEYLLNQVGELEQEAERRSIVSSMTDDYRATLGYGLPVFISEYGFDRFRNAIFDVGYKFERLVDRIEPASLKRQELFNEIDSFNQTTLEKRKSIEANSIMDFPVHMQLNRNELGQSEQILTDLVDKNDINESNNKDRVNNFLANMRKVENFYPLINETIKSADPVKIEELFNSLENEYSVNGLKEQIEILSTEIDSMIAKIESDENSEFDSKYESVISQIKSIEMMISGLPEGDDSRTVLEGALSTIKESMDVRSKSKNEKIDLLTKDLRDAKNRLSKLVK